MNVIKRDGRVVEFDKKKIKNAIMHAFVQVDDEITETATAKANEIANYISKIEDDMTVEGIQDIIQEKLMASNRKDVACEYVKYRYKKEVARKAQTDFIDAIREKLNASAVQNQNANVDEHSFGGRTGEASSVVTKKLALDHIVSPMAKKNHENNMIYIHDLDAYYVGSHNCLSIPFDDLLANGFNTRQTDVRPAGSASTAFQLVAVIFQLQSLQQFGGVSATHLDWTMVPYVRRSFKKHFSEGAKYVAKVDSSIEQYLDTHKELSFNYPGLAENYPEVYKYAMDMTEKEIYQASEGLYHNLNTLQSRSGNQLPFTSINYGTCTEPEGRLVTKALLETSIKGLGSLYKTSIFPCGIFQYKKGINDKPGTPNYDLYRLALQSTSKRLYPNYANVDWSGNAGYDPEDPRTYFSTMGCRTANGADINAEEGTNPQTKDGRGNICPVTIILPTLAMIAKEQASTNNSDVVEEFMNLLDIKIGEAKDMLIERFEWICSQSPDSAKFMYQNNTMLGYHPDQGIRSALKHGTLALGQIGLAETLQILIGKDHTTDEGMELAKRIERLFNTRCAEFKKKYKLNIGVYYTPAENLCYTSMSKFKKQYGELKNISDREYFTNSIHVPVWHDLSPFDKIDIESQLTGYSNAGCITYVELDSTANKNIDALEEIVNYAMDKDIPYFAINIPNDICLECGYTGEFNAACPACGSTHIQQLRRVTGYLTGDYKSAFNYGKQKETEERRKHVGVLE